MSANPPMFTRPLGPFAILYETCTKHCPPKVRKPQQTKSKAQQAAMALETPAERKERQAAERQKAMAAILRKNSYSDSARSTDNDKTGRIIGRRNEARSQ